MIVKGSIRTRSPELLAAVTLSIILVAFLLPVSSNSIPSRMNTPIQERFVGAYYYVWFSEGWTTKDDIPLLGYYSSENESIIREHLDWAKMAAIDFLAISWSDSPKWYNGKTALASNAVFDVDDRIGSPVKLAIMIEYWHGEFLNLSESANTIYVRYALRPSYFRLYGKPLLFVYTLDDYSPPTWNDSRFTVRYIPREVPYGRDTFIERSIQNRTTYEFTGVSPHKDNSHSDTSRADGFYYSEIWNYVIQFSKLAADRTVIVMIASFNEWWESTGIEPSASYGFQYLDLTRDFVARFKQGS